MRINKQYNIAAGGICISQLSFNTPKPFNAVRAAKVTIDGISGAGEYYISNRTLSNGVYTITCLDRNAFLDTPLDFEAFDDSVKKSETVNISTVLDKVLKDLGYNGWGGLPSWCQMIYTSDLENTTVAQVLTKIAEACIGVWCCTSTNNLQFVPYGAYSGRIAISQHTAVDVGADQNYNGVIYRDSEGNTVKQGTGTQIYEVLEIESDLYTINTGYEEEVYNRVSKTKSTVFRCDKAKIEGNVIPDAVTSIIFQQFNDNPSSSIITEYIANSFELSITSSGVYASIGMNADGQDEIRTNGKITRALENKVDYGRFKNAVLTKFQGYMYSEEEEPANDNNNK